MLTYLKTHIVPQMITVAEMTQLRIILGVMRSFLVSLGGWTFTSSSIGSIPRVRAGGPSMMTLISKICRERKGKQNKE